MANAEVLEQAVIASFKSLLLKSLLYWAGHVYKVEVFWLSKTAIQGELSTGHQDREAPKGDRRVPGRVLCCMTQQPPQVVNDRCTL